MNLILQNKMTLEYVLRRGEWTREHGRAQVFDTGLEALYFCFNNHLGSMQIIGASGEAFSFKLPVTDQRG